MKDFLKTTLIEPFTEGWFGWLLGILMWILLLGLSTLGIGCILNGGNRIGRQEQKGIGIVIEKCFVPAHRESYGKGQSRWVDDAWHLHLEKDSLSDCIWVSHHYYCHTEIGDKICMIYYTGRLWSSLYIVSFCGT